MEPNQLRVESMRLSAGNLNLYAQHEGLGKVPTGSPCRSEQTSFGKDGSSPKWRSTLPRHSGSACWNRLHVRGCAGLRVQVDGGPGSGQRPPRKVPAAQLSPVLIPVPQADTWSEFILESKAGLAVTVLS